MGTRVKSVQVVLQYPIIAWALFVFAVLVLMMVLGVVLDDPAYAKARHDA